MGSGPLGSYSVSTVEEPDGDTMTIKPNLRRRWPLLLTALLGPAHAVELNSGVEGLKLRWDNTLKYSAAWRLREPSNAVLAYQGVPAVNNDDGDRNFGRGLISNRLDLLSEFDAVYRGFGARVSGAAWADSAYLGRNDHDSPDTVNHTSAPYNAFTDDVKHLLGRRAELLDAFVFGRAELGSARATFRFGRHALQWGETLFFGYNGIAAAQAPIDVVKARAVPNSQFKEFMRPTNQLSGQLQLTPDLAIGAYYKLAWERDRLPPSGSYFSFGDILDVGAERIFTPGGPAQRGADVKPGRSGHYGLQARWRVDDTDLGVYAVRYHATGPHVVVDAIGATETLAFHKGIRAYGISASRTLGEFNLAAEASVRRNVDLNSGVNVYKLVAFGPPVPQLGAAPDNDGNPLYPVGNTAHLNVSVFAPGLSENFLAKTTDLLFEVAWNRVTGVTRNANELDPGSKRDGLAARVVFEPHYNQALPGLDLSVPLGLGWQFLGKGQALAQMQGQQIGDLSIGLNASYLEDWKLSLAYTRFLGRAAPVADPAAPNAFTYGQPLADRDFVSLSFRRTF